MAKTVDQIQTKDTVFFTGVGDLGKTINDSRTQKVSKFPGLTLERAPEGIEIHCYGKYMLIPWDALKGIVGRTDDTKQVTQQPAPVKVRVDTSAANR